MFRALLVHHQEALHVQQLVYFVRIVLAGCWQGWSGTVAECSPHLVPGLQWMNIYLPSHMYLHGVHRDSFT
jgi:hypothetical protein